MESIAPRFQAEHGAGDSGRQGDGVKVTWTGAAIVAAWVASAAVTYAAMSARVSVVEAAQQRMERDIGVIMSDVKTLIRGGGR